MRSSQLSCDKEEEVLAILDRSITQSNLVSSSAFLYLFSKDCLDDLFESLTSILKHNWNTIAYASSQKISHLCSVHCRFDYLHISLLVCSFDPSMGLHLRINDQRPSIRIIHNDSIISGEIIRRQRVEIPLSHLDFVTKNFFQTDNFGTLDLELFHQLNPYTNALCSIGLSKYTKICNNT